jgi:hypothetical protein
MSEEKKIARDIEKKNLFKRLAEIDKEEEVENGQEQEQKILFDDEIDMNTKVKRKRDTGTMIFDDLTNVIDLTENDKIFLETKQQQYVKEFLEKFTDNDFYTYSRTFMNKTENIIHLFY